MSTDLISIITDLSRSKNESVNVALHNSGAGKNLISNLRRGSSPSFEKMIQLANYFGVSLDYLAGMDDKTAPVRIVPEAPPAVPTEARKLVEEFTDMNAEGQERLMEYVQLLANSGIYKKRDTHRLGKQA